jgi:hypothetical protein
LPQAVQRAYITGTSSVTLNADPARIPIDASNWFGDYLSPYMRVYVNGRGPFTFLFDTGSSYTFVSSRLVAAAKLDVVSNVRGHHKIVKMRDVRVGPITMRDDVAVVSDGDDVDGIFGFNAFADDYLTFDFANRTLLVSSHMQPLPGSASVPYVLERRVPNIELTIDGRSLPTLIDTGDDAYAWEATSNDLTGLLFDSEPIVAARVHNGVTGWTQTTITSIDGALKVGPFVAERPAVAINESLPMPDVGVEFVRQFVMEFDRHRQRVILQPAFAGMRFAVPGKLTTGFFISYREPGRRVSAVLPSLAPARAGMQEGDSIIAINGRHAEDVDYRGWLTLVNERKPITIRWQHNRQRYTRTFDVVELK